MKIPDSYTREQYLTDRRYLSRRKTDPLCRLTSSPLTYLIGGLFFTGASALLTNQTDPDTTEQTMDFIGPRFFQVVAGANYLMSGLMAWAWRRTKGIIRDYENQELGQEIEDF